MDGRPLSVATCRVETGAWRPNATRRARRLALAAAFAACALAGCGGESGPELPQGPPGRPAFGFNDNSVRAGLLSPERDAELTARVGGTVSRLTFDWRWAEPAPDHYRLEEYDRIYRALLARGVRPLWIPMFAPSWAWDPGTRCRGDCRYPPSRRAEGEWGELLALLARRYPRSAGIEQWNEPNLRGFWQPRPDPNRFVRLMRVGYRAVKRVRPGMPVVNGGLANTQVTENGAVSLPEYLEAVLRAGGKRFTDAIVFHAYAGSRDDPGTDRTVAQVLDLRHRHRADRRPLWITEIGATTTGTETRLRWSEKAQAEELVSAWERLRRVSGVEMFLVHTLIDPPNRGRDPERGYGLLRPDGSPKPAYCALGRRMAARFRCP